jgi:uncharacterized paraquat-inducible protein A
MQKERAQVTYLLMALTVLAMVILILNHLALPSFVMLVAVLTLIALGVVTLRLIWRIHQRTKSQK